MLKKITSVCVLDTFSKSIQKASPIRSVYDFLILPRKKSFSLFHYKLIYVSYLTLRCFVTDRTSGNLKWLRNWSLLYTCQTSYQFDVMRNSGHVPELVRRLEDSPTRESARADFPKGSILLNCSRNVIRDFQFLWLMSDFPETVESFVNRSEVWERSRWGSFDGLPFYI